MERYRKENLTLIMKNREKQVCTHSQPVLPPELCCLLLSQLSASYGEVGPAAGKRGTADAGDKEQTSPGHS